MLSIVVALGIVLTLVLSCRWVATGAGVFARGLRFVLAPGNVTMLCSDDVLVRST